MATFCVCAIVYMKPIVKRYDLQSTYHSYQRMLETHLLETQVTLNFS